MDMNVRSINLPTVLAVDDMPMNLRMIKVFLEKKFNVIPAKSGAEALKVLTDRKVDVVLLDIEMPVMTGFEFLKKMKDLPKGKDTPVICVTGMDATPELIATVVHGGAKDFLSKPFDQYTLMHKVQKILGLKTDYVIPS
ncbi:hypothetical protein AGMMS50212_03530 [Spirochaetia bacterium]|nr:hypothetical protein AGMMS50212_03530 [Spirochaetia bacterium]